MLAVNDFLRRRREKTTSFIPQHRSKLDQSAAFQLRDDFLLLSPIIAVRPAFLHSDKQDCTPGRTPHPWPRSHHRTVWFCRSWNMLEFACR